MPRGETRAFRIVFIALLALHLAVVLSARLFPFTDLPDHLAAAAIARAQGDPASPLAATYAVEASLKPNTAHLRFCSLPIFPSVELANRIYLAVCVLLLPVAVLVAIRRLGGNPWFALLSFFYVYSYSVSWGFVGFALAIPLAILFYGLLAADGRGVTGASRILEAAGALALLYFVHVLAALFLALALFLAAAMRRRGAARALGSTLLACVPFAVLILLWWRGETRGYAGTGLAAFLSRYYRETFFAGLPARLGVFVFDNYHLFAGTAAYAIPAIFSAAVLGGAAWAALRGRSVPDAILRRSAPAGPDSESRPSRAALPLLFAALLSSALLPNEIPQQSILYQRFSVFLFLAIVIWGGAKAGSRAPHGEGGAAGPRGDGARAGEKAPRVVALAFAALALFHFALWADCIFDFNGENAGFDGEFLRPARSGQKLAGIVDDYRYRGKPIYIHFPSYYIVWEKEPATATLVDYRFGPVRRRVSPVELPRYLEWAGKLGTYDGRYRDMDYLLMRGGSPPAGFAVVRTAGRWTLGARTPASR